MRNASNSAAYLYLANSPLVSQITFKSNTMTRMATTKTFDFLNRLTQISSVPSASSAATFNYSYNNANQRVQVNLADGSFWIYVYDSLGQVISGKKYWQDWTPVAVTGSVNGIVIYFLTAKPRFGTLPAWHVNSESSIRAPCIM